MKTIRVMLVVLACAAITACGNVLPTAPSSLDADAALQQGTMGSDGRGTMGSDG